MAEQTETQEEEVVAVDPMDKVRAWRFDELMRAGYSHDLAQVVANCLDVDLHVAVEMVGAGCKPSTAVYILL